MSGRLMSGSIAGGNGSDGTLADRAVGIRLLDHRAVGRGVDALFLLFPVLGGLYGAMRGEAIDVAITRGDDVAAALLLTAPRSVAVSRSKANGRPHRAGRS
jgi:hypothetical protein